MTPSAPVRSPLRLADTATVVLIAALPFLVFGSVTLGRLIWATGDFSSYQHPLTVVIVDQLRQGILPLWNPYIHGGAPLLAAQQGAIFYPLNYLPWLLLPPATAVAAVILGHLSLTGLGTFAFMRALKLQPAAAALGAMVMALGGFTMSHLGHVGVLRALPWVGFGLFAVVRWFERQSPWALAGIATSSALLATSGFPQMTANALIFTGTFVLFGTRGTGIQRLAALGMMALGVGGAAIQLVPWIELWRGGEYVRPGTGVFDALMGYSFHPSYLVTLLSPRARDGTYAEMVGYVGVIPFLVALLSLTHARTADLHRTRWFFGVWAVAAMLLAFGRFVPFLSDVVFHTPILGTLGVPSKHLMEFTFAMAVLAGLGLDGLLRHLPSLPIRRRALAVSGLGLIIVTWLAFSAPFTVDAPRLSFASPLRTIVQPVVLLVIGGTSLVWCRRTTRWAIGLVLAVTIVDLVDFGRPIYSGSLRPPRFYDDPPATALVLDQLGRNDRPFRVLSFEAHGADLLDIDLAKEMLATNYSAAYGIESIIGHDGLMLRRVLEVFRGRIPPWGYVSVDAVDHEDFRTALDRFGVRYLLVRTESAGSLQHYYPEVYRTARVVVFENPAAAARVTVVPPDSGAVSSTVALVRYDATGVAANVMLSRAASVVHASPWVPGWRASIDGVTVPVEPAEGVWQAIDVPAGTHRVEFRYEPAGVRVGAMISAMCIVLVVLLPAGAGWWRDRSARSPGAVPAALARPSRS